MRWDTVVGTRLTVRLHAVGRGRRTFRPETGSSHSTRSMAVAGQVDLVHTVSMRRGKNIVRPLYCDL